MAADYLGHFVGDSALSCPGIGSGPAAHHDDSVQPLHAPIRQGAAAL